MTTVSRWLTVACAAWLCGCGTKGNPVWGIADGAGSVGSSTTSTPTSGSTTSPTASSGSESSTTSTGTSDSTSTTTASTETDSTAGFESTGTAGVGTSEPFCQGLLLAHETFDDPPSEPPWVNVGNPGQMIPVLANGRLRIVANIQAGQAPANWRLHWLPTPAQLPLVGSVGMEVVSAPTSGFISQVFVGAEDGLGQRYYLEFYDDLLIATRFTPPDDYDDLNSLPYDPASHRWFRMTFDQSADEVGFDISPDGETWTSFVASVPTGSFDLSTAFPVFFAGTTVEPLMQSFATLDNAFVCDLS